MVSCSDATAGTLADPGYGGIVGSDVLRRFTATFDYPRSRLSLHPNAAFSEPFEFDLAGLFMFVDEGIRVFSVVDGSPAAQAGIRPGDRIRTDRALDELRRAFRSKPGRSFTLELERAGQSFTTAIEQRRLV